MSNKRKATLAKIDKLQAKLENLAASGNYSAFFKTCEKEWPAIEAEILATVKPKAKP